MRCIFLHAFVYVISCAVSYAFDVRYTIDKNDACLSTKFQFRSFTKIPLNRCLKECAVRPRCLAVNYHRSYQLCELLDTDTGIRSNHAPSCRMIRKSNIQTTLPPDCAYCTLKERCEVNETNGLGTCVIQECKPLQPNHGYVLGNKHEVSSSIVYECDYGYKRSTVNALAVCEIDGEWTGTPQCIQVTCDPQGPLNGLADLTLTYTVDKELHYYCNYGYKTTTRPLCQQDGNWSSEPVCEQVICHPPGVANGHVDDQTPYTVDMKLSFKCNNGYIQKTHPTCKQDGTWSEAPYCAEESTGGGCCW